MANGQRGGTVVGIIGRYRRRRRRMMVTHFHRRRERWSDCFVELAIGFGGLIRIVGVGRSSGGDRETGSR